MKEFLSIWVPSLSLGVGLGLLPHALGFALGFANFIVTPVLLPILGIAGGAMLIRRQLLPTWKFVLSVAFTAALIYVAGFLASFAALYVINGEFQTFDPLQLLSPFVTAFVAGVIFIGLGALLGLSKRRAG